MKEKIEFKPIFKQRLAGYLMQRGFVLMGIKPDENNRYNVFFFKKSGELEDAIDDYFNGN